jgi:two-component system, cell cycle response regulator
MTTGLITILLVEDNPGDARLLHEAFAEIPDSRFELAHCGTLAQALEFLAQSKPDIVLSDLGLPDSQGLEAVRRIHEVAPDVPLVVLTALNDDALALQSLQQGAQDYLVKGQIDGDLLWRALCYAMERQRIHLLLLNLALIDDLTGLNNRRGFMALAGQQMKLAYRTQKPFLLVFIDLDGMKRINDTFGHQEGNRALVDTACVLKDSFRQSDVLARLGGDEFVCLVVDGVENTSEVVSHRIQQKLISHNADVGRRYDLSFSVGIVAADMTQPADLEQLLSKADAVMYQQKQEKLALREAAGLNRENF